MLSQRIAQLPRTAPKAYTTPGVGTNLLYTGKLHCMSDVPIQGAEVLAEGSM